MDLARRAEVHDEDSDGAQDDESEESPPLKPDGEGAETDGDDGEANVPPGVVLFDDVFFGVPRDGGLFLYHNFIIA